MWGEDSVAGEVWNLEFESEIFLLQSCQTEMQYKPHLQATCLILNFLIAMFKKSKNKLVN